MRILALDPGSSVIGYAVMDGPTPAELVEAGLLRPAGWRGSPPELAAWRRIRSLAAHVAVLVDEWFSPPDRHAHRIVIEIPSGLIRTGARRGARGSLTTYGLAAGYIAATCHRGRVPVVAVTEREWTAGQGDKRARQLAIASLYGRTYHAARDPGADAADAIGLGRWWFARFEARRDSEECGATAAKVDT